MYIFICCHTKEHQSISEDKYKQEEIKLAQNVKYFKTLRLINENYIVAPKYKEFSVAKLWLYKYEISKLNQYFSNWKKWASWKDQMLSINSHEIT